MGSKRRSINRRSKKQRLYKMKGCSRKRCMGGKKSKGRKSRRHISRPNLFVTYTGGNHDTFPVSTQVPSPYGGQFGSQTGGDCGCSAVMKGGGKRGGHKGGQRGGKWQKGGCGDSMCSVGGAQGGGAQGGGAPALVGAPWDPTNPGALPVPNYFRLNTYDTDISRQMVATGAQPPFSVGGAREGGRGRRRRGKSQKGGGLLDYGPYIAGSVTSALGGYKGPVSPSPVVGQFASSAEHI